MKISEYTYRVMEIPANSQSVEMRLNYLWMYFSQYIGAKKLNTGWDSNAFETVQMMDIGNEMSSNQKKIIKNVSTWHASQWTLYRNLKPLVSAGTDVDLPIISPCPSTFDQFINDTPI